MKKELSSIARFSQPFDPFKPNGEQRPSVRLLQALDVIEPDAGRRATLGHSTVTEKYKSAERAPKEMHAENCTKYLVYEG